MINYIAHPTSVATSTSSHSMNKSQRQLSQKRVISTDMLPDAHLLPHSQKKSQTSCQYQSWLYSVSFIRKHFRKPQGNLWVCRNHLFRKTSYHLKDWLRISQYRVIFSYDNHSLMSPKILKAHIDSALVESPGYSKIQLFGELSSQAVGFF